MVEFVNLLIKSFSHSSYWSKVAKVSIENLTNDSVIPIIHEKDFEMESFVMGFHEYKNASTPVKNKN